MGQSPTLVIPTLERSEEGGICCTRVPPEPRLLADGFLVFLFRGKLTQRRHSRLRGILPLGVLGPPFSLGAGMTLRHAVS